MTARATPIVTARIGPDCIIPPDAEVEAGAQIGPRVVLAGPGISIKRGAILEAASVIGERVIVGQGAVVRAGSVVLKSIPPNAIVEGNPAQVIGYAQTDTAKERDMGFIVADSVFSTRDEPAHYSLGVGDAALHRMRAVTDVRGSLSVGELESELPFRPARYFLVYDVPSAELRGEHAHKECMQFLICAHGSCRVMLDDGQRRCEVLLDRPNLGVFMPPMIWGTQYRYSADAVLLVFASLPYEPEDYVRTYDAFLAEVERRAGQ